MYSALWIYFCIYSKKKNKKILCKKNITLLVLTLLIPFALGCLYHFAPGIYSHLNQSTGETIDNVAKSVTYYTGEGIATYGYIYVSFYTNIIIFVPLAVYYLYKKEKEGNLFSFDTLCLLFLISFILLLVIGIAFGKVSFYYTMKNYYILWLVMIYINFKALKYVKDKHPKLPSILVCCYTLCMLLSLVFVRVPLARDEINETKGVPNFFEVFGFNKTTMLERELDLDREEIEILRHAKNNFDFKNDKIEILGYSEQGLWSYDLLRYVNYDDFFEKVTYGQFRLRSKGCIST